MRDKCSVLRLVLLGELGASHDVFPVVRLKWCLLEHSLVPLRREVVDLTSCIGHSVDLDTAVAFGSLSLRLDLMVLLRLLIRVWCLLLSRTAPSVVRFRLVLR